LTDIEPSESRSQRRFAIKPIQLDTQGGSIPPQRPSNLWKKASLVVVPGIFILMLIAFLYLAKSLLVPVVAAAVISATLAPLSRRAERYHIPGVLFALFGVVLVLALINVILLLLGGTISSWAARAPEIAATLKEKSQVLDRPLAALREFQTALAAMLGAGAPEPVKLDFSAGSLITPILGVLTPALGELVLFFGSLFFFLLGRSRQRKFVVLMFSTQDARLRALRILNDIEHNFTRYLLIVSAINLLVGAVVAIIALVAGLDTPFILGMAAFVLNFVPYIGPGITAFLLFAVGLMTLPTLVGAFFPPAFFLIFATIEGQFLTPSLLGRQLTVSPLAIFLSLAFWTWLWGPAGTFLSMPFLIAATMIREHLFSQEKAVPLPA
jgi:predicted PurR-regulated permease PerM